MSQHQLTERVCRLVAAELYIAESKVLRTSRFYEDLGADSLDCVELHMVFEQEFQIEIPDQGVEELATVGELCDYLEKRGVTA